jgi:putative protease
LLHKCNIRNVPMLHYINNKQIKKPKLLSPAGNIESLKAAVQMGADEVYFGYERFGARAFAENFSHDDIRHGIEYAKLRGVKTYLALNTLIKNSELNDALQLCKYAWNEGIDAIIVQDIGLIHLLKTKLPEIILHGSTQLSIYNKSGALFAENIGLKRVVIARETGIDEISEIIDNTQIEIEIFIHGALCVSYSGQCLLSSMIGGRSGNRGMCAQPCRLPYNIFTESTGIVKSSDKPGKYIISPKDLSTLYYLPKIISSGVSSLKIEGRMRPIEYIATATAIYRKYIDIAYECFLNNKEYSVDSRDADLLLQSFNRGGNTKGFLMNEKNIIYNTSPTNLGDLMENDLLKTTIRDRYRNENNIKKLIEIDISVLKSGICNISAIIDKQKISYEYSLSVEPAKTRGTGYTDFAKAFLKTSGTPFNIGISNTDIPANIFVSMANLNKLRKNFIADITKHLLRKTKRNTSFNQIPSSPELSGKKNKPVLSVCLYSSISNFDLRDFYDMRIYIPYIDILKTEAIRLLKQNRNEVFAAIPNIVTNENRLLNIISHKDTELLDGFYISNPGQIQILKHVLQKKSISAGFELNIMNSDSLEFLQYNKLNSACISPELNHKEIINLVTLPNCQKEMLIFGRVPLMTMKTCPIKNELGICIKDKRDTEQALIIDRINKSFILKCDHENCIIKLFNADRLIIEDDFQKYIESGITLFRINLLDESASEIKEIFKFYKNILEGQRDLEGILSNIKEQGFTRGHLNRGVK